MQFFENCSEPMKQQVNQISKAINATRKARPAQKPLHQTKLVKNEPAFREITAEMKHRRKSYGNGLLRQ
jgi:hypothetical protein